MTGCLKKRLGTVGFGLLGLGSSLVGLSDSTERSAGPSATSPTLAGVIYGGHARHRLDLWHPGSERPAPVLIYFHGGGFVGGDKRDIPADLLMECHIAGIAVVSANYRFSHQAPFPAPMLDGARVVQFVRSNASRWGLDPDRVGLAGNSAGGGIALWVALHDDLERRDSADPSERTSSRVRCVAVVGAQTSYDPVEIREWIGGRAHEHPALSAFFGVETGRWDREKCRDASPIHHVSSDDPPVWMYYGEADGPLLASARPGEGIHHPNFGRRFRDRLEPLGVSCSLSIRDGRVNDSNSMVLELVEFVETHLARETAESGINARGRSAD